MDGKRVLSVGGGGTGKFDRLRPDHDAIVIDDDVCPNLLNMTDNYICRAYKRNSNNPAWAGRYFIVTSNLPFADWLDSCGLRVKTLSGNLTPHYTAMLSRFFVCVLQSRQGINHLALCSPSTRGSEQEQLERAEMFAEFAERFNSIIASYTPATDGDHILDLIATLDPFDSTWDKLESELTAWEATKEPSDDAIDAYIEYQARKELGEPVTFDGTAVYLPPWYERLDWCNPNYSPKQREELRQRQLAILAEWNCKQLQVVEAAQKQQPQQGLYNPPDRQY